MFVLHVSKIYNFSRLIISIFIPNCLFSLAIGFCWGLGGGGGGGGGWGGGGGGHEECVKIPAKCLISDRF